MYSLTSLRKEFLQKGFGIYSLEDQIRDSIITSVSKSIKERYGEELYLYGNEIIGVMDWIKKYDKKFENRSKSTNGVLVDSIFVMTLDKDTYAFVKIQNDSSAYSRRDDSSDRKGISIYIFGKKYKQYVKELTESISRYDNSSLYIYNVKGASGKGDDNSEGISSVGRVMTRRSIDTLFFNNDIKESICDHIENFFKNKTIYEEKNLIYKTGILLYGEPGTGKSSLATALASKYNYNLIVIDMTTFDKLDVTTLTNTLNVDTDNYIILLEDIDTLFDSLNREDNIDKDERKIVNKMLQFLDSSSSPNDIIFIATTNHVDRLDDAITRDGRFDLKVEISNIDVPTAEKMIKSFNVTEQEDINTIISRCDKKDNGTINPAELQNKILGFFKEQNKLKDMMEEK